MPIASRVRGCSTCSPERPRSIRRVSGGLYSNSNYFLLATVIEHVTGMTHDRYLAEIFFAPLELGSTGGCASARIMMAANRAVGYELVEGSFRVRPLSTTKANAFVGAGGLCSNATDLVQWMRALIDGKVVSPGSLQQMTTAAPVGAGFTPPYGYGLSLKPLVGQRAVWHIGSMSGFMSVLAYLPDQDVIIAALANRRQAPVDALVKKIARALLDLPAPVLLDLPVPAAERTRSIGNYDDGMFKFKVYQQGEQLYVDVHPSVHRCGFATRVRTNSRRRSPARAASGSSRPRVPLSASTGNGLTCGRSGAEFSEGAARSCLICASGARVGNAWPDHLLRHSIQDGDAAQVFDRALTVLLEQLAKRKLAATQKPRAGCPRREGLATSPRR